MMSEKAIYISQLIQKKLKSGLSEAEQIHLDEWLAASPANRGLYEQLNDEEWLAGELKKFERYDELGMKRKILDLLNSSQAGTGSAKVRSIRPVWMRWVAAAAFIGFLVLGVWFFVERESEIGDQKPGIAVVNDVEAPKLPRAMITLADGSTVALDSLTSITEEGAVLTKNAQGGITYDAVSLSLAKTEAAYNTLVNPRGSKVISLTMSDGTRVWLNAGSSITYPVAFVGDERRVEVSGEAYFEVSRLSPAARPGSMAVDLIPFLVESNGVLTEVLGTHFNVNAYPDEAAVRVTLLEGIVKVTAQQARGESATLRPGQQATATNKELKLLAGVDTDAVMAWKNGMFRFDRTDIQSVMRQISRWYDVEVVYPKGVPDTEYWGAIRRDLSLAGVVKVLEESGGHFRIEGRKLTVLP